MAFLSKKMKITVITPSVRKQELELNRLSLKRQTLARQHFEWIVISPFEYAHSDIWIKDPPKYHNNFYVLCKAYNEGFKYASGDLIVSYQDAIEMEPTTLERLWEHYKANPKACVGAIGHQWKDNVIVWNDPRQTDQYGSFYECEPIDIEFTLCSLPKKAVFDVGGMDIEFDNGAAVGEKEMLTRIDRAGYKTYLDQSIVYFAQHHPRLTKNWDDKYKIASDYYQQCLEKLYNGERPIKLDYLTLYG